MFGRHSNIILLHGCVHSIFINWHGPSLSYPDGKENLENKKKQTPVQIMYNAGLKNKIIVNSVEIFNDNFCYE